MLFDLAPAVRLKPRRTSASCARTSSSAPLSPSRAVISVEPTMSVNMTARNPESTAGAAAPGATRGSLMRPRNASTAARSTGMMALGMCAMCLTMDSLGGRLVRRMDEAEGGSIVLVEPIGHVFYAVSVLNVDIPAVRLCDITRLHAAQVVAVHENWHVISLGRRSGRVKLRGDRRLRRKRLWLAPHLLETTISASASACKDPQRLRK